MLLGLARKRNDSEAHYRNMQRLIATSSVEELRFRGVDLESCSMLELAAGHGGYTQVFAELSPDLVATDLHRAPVFDGELSHVAFQEVDATGRFPFPDGRFDVVYCASLIEHLADRSSLYSETRRVLASGGKALFSFPPFWSLTMVGGHRFKPFHLLGEKVAVRSVSLRDGVDIGSYGDDYGHGGLYQLTIGGVADELTESGWRVVDRWARMWPVNTARLPGILADWLTWHACLLVEPTSN